MPLTEKNLEIEAPLEFGMLMLEDDQDDTFFSHNSPYSTVRANDLKRGTGRQSQNQRSSVAELLSLWIKDNLPQDTDAEPNEAPVENDVIEVDTSLQDYELPVKGKKINHIVMLLHCFYSFYSNLYQPIFKIKKILITAMNESKTKNDVPILSLSATLKKIFCALISNECIFWKLF